MLQLTCYSHSPLCASGHNNDGDGAGVGGGGGSNGDRGGRGDGGVVEDGGSNINDNAYTQCVRFPSSHSDTGTIVWNANLVMPL